MHGQVVLLVYGDLLLLYKMKKVFINSFQGFQMLFLIRLYNLLDGSTVPRYDLTRANYVLATKRTGPTPAEFSTFEGVVRM